MGEKTRIHVRFRDHEFDAEGPVEVVRLQYEQFLKLVGDEKAAVHASLPIEVIESALHNRCPGTSLPLPLPSFPILPLSDYLVLVLYGALAVLGVREVSASDLMTVLKHRGVSPEEPERIDRLFASHTGFVVKTGAKRGSKYAITQEGIRHAETMIVTRLAKK